MGVPTGQVVAQQLRAAGIDRVFCVVAGPMAELLQALTQTDISVVSCRNEQQAAFMAQAWGYQRSCPGVLVVGSGPGMTNAVTGMYLAGANRWPLVVLGGSAFSQEREVGSFQEAPQIEIAQHCCKWVARVDAPERAGEFVWMALERSLNSPRGSVYVDFPAETVLGARVDSAVDALVVPVASRHFEPAPAAGAIGEVSEMLAGAERPLLIIGPDAAWSDDGAGLRPLVELGLPFLPLSMGRGVVPDDHPMCVAAARSLALTHADCVLMIGGRFDWMVPMFHRFRSTPRQDSRIAQITSTADDLIGGVDLDAAVVGSLPEAIGLLTEAMRGRRGMWDPWLSQLRGRVGQNRTRVTESIAAANREAIGQLVMFDSLRHVVTADTILVVDGEVTLAMSRMLMSTSQTRMRLDSGVTGCMGTGVPYAIASKLARPDKRVIAVLGDYAFGASAMELETAARMGLDLVFVVANNQGIVGRSMQEALYEPSGQPVASLLPARYELLAEMVGGHAEVVERVDDLVPALRRACDSPGVAVVNVVMDPHDHGFYASSDYLTGGYTIREPSIRYGD